MNTRNRYNQDVKVALVHDYIKEYGGAERVLEALHELYPDAPVYTSVYLPEFLGPHRERFNPPAGGWDIRTSWAQNLPFKSKLISPLRLVAPFLFGSFDLSNYDVVIVSATGAYASNAVKTRSLSSRAQRGDLQEIASSQAPRNDSSRQDGYQTVTRQARTIKRPLHICYCHTPPRYLYGYATAREWKNNIILRVLGEIANHFLRIIDFKSAQNVDYFIANSQEVASRIKKFYRRNPEVIYPPVEVGKDIKIQRYKDIKEKDKKYSPNISISQYPNYFLAGGRLARAKHVDLIVRACSELNVPLKVFGKGFGGNEISNIKYPISNIQFVGEVSDEEKMELMKNAKAYVFASEEEDFGITPVEAMSVGTPVIAYRSGGVQESVVEGKTGIFFDELTVESLKKVMSYYNDTYHYSMREACIKQAQKYSKDRFLKEIGKFVKEKLQSYNKSTI